MSYIDDLVDGDVGWNLVALGAAGLAGIATRSLLESGWERVKGEEPPENPAARSVGWAEALAWAAATGVLIEVSRMLAHRGAAAGWKRVRGHYPRGLE